MSPIIGHELRASRGISLGFWLPDAVVADADVCVFVIGDDPQLLPLPLALPPTPPLPLPQPPVSPHSQSPFVSSAFGLARFGQNEWLKQCLGDLFISNHA